MARRTLVAVLVLLLGVGVGAVLSRTAFKPIYTFPGKRMGADLDVARLPDPAAGGWDAWAAMAAPGSSLLVEPAASRPDTVRLVPKPKVDGTPYDVQFYRDVRSPSEGREAELSFEARADAPRTIVCAIEKRSGEQRTLLFSEEVKLASEWRTFRFRVKDPDGVELPAAVQFFLGSSNAPVELRRIRCVEIAP